MSELWNGRIKRANPPFYYSLVLSFKICLRLVTNQKCMSNPLLITTSTHLEGYKITKQLGLVRGITVRSRNFVSGFFGNIMSAFGGRNSVFTNLCETAREEALQLLIEHAEEKGANAIINVRYDANDVMPGLTEVLGYGSAVVVEKV